MSGKEHRYALTVTWTGDRDGRGTAGYRDYDRSITVSADGKPELLGTADAAFLGDPAHWNPEDLLVASLSECHLLSYLALCANSGVVVTGYRDEPSGTMVEAAGGGGEFTEVTLRPTVTVADEAMVNRAESLHAKANSICFIARSVKFPVLHEPAIIVAG